MRGKNTTEHNGDEQRHLKVLFQLSFFSHTHLQDVLVEVIQELQMVFLIRVKVVVSRELFRTGYTKFISQWKVTSTF